VEKVRNELGFPKGVAEQSFDLPMSAHNRRTLMDGEQLFGPESAHLSDGKGGPSLLFGLVRTVRSGPDPFLVTGSDLLLVLGQFQISNFLLDLHSFLISEDGKN
jgi:hypothetical protein